MLAYIPAPWIRHGCGNSLYQKCANSPASLADAGPGHGARAAMERAALIEVETGVPIFRDILSATLW